MMKKFLFVLLALMLLLTACGNQTPQETSVPTTEPTEPPGIYVENSPIEQQTRGAVREFDPEGTYTALSAIGDQLLLISKGEKTSLQLLTGDRRVVTATAQLNFDITDTVYQTTYAGMVYYDRQNREAVFLNTQLQESERVKMPEEMEGYPAFSPNGNEIFYWVLPGCSSPIPAKVRCCWAVRLREKCWSAAWKTRQGSIIRSISLPRPVRPFAQTTLCSTWQLMKMLIL